MMYLNIYFEIKGSKSQSWSPKRKDRITDNTYQMSRWTPIVSRCKKILLLSTN